MVMQPIDLTVRSEVNTYISQSQHDANLTLVQTAINALISWANGMETTVGSKMNRLSDDKTPALGGPLVGSGYAISGYAEKTGFKTQSFSYSPLDGRMITYSNTGDFTCTLPTDLSICPLGTVFAVEIINNCVATFQTDVTTPTVGRPKNRDGQYKVSGPQGTAYLRVFNAVASAGVWKLSGDTIA